MSTNVPASPDKLFIGGIPSVLSEAQVLELLQTIGPLRAFNLVKEGGTSKGYAFALYPDAETTDRAIAGLHDMELLGKKMVVQRASVGVINGDAIPADVSQPVYMPGKVEPSRIIQLHNLVSEEELRHPELCAGLLFYFSGIRRARRLTKSRRTEARH